MPGRLAGIEWFDAAATLQKLLPKIVSSYALDAALTPTSGASAPARQIGPDTASSASVARPGVLPAAVGVDTLHDEAGGEDHFKDFMQTMAFLQNDVPRTSAFRVALGEYRRELMRYTGSGALIRSARELPRRGPCQRV